MQPINIIKKPLFLLVFIFNYSHLFSQKETNKEILWTADWSPNTDYIAIGGNIDTLRLYNSDEFSLQKTFPIGNTITRVKWHPTNNLIAVITQNSNDKARLLNLNTGEMIELSGICSDGARAVDWNYTGDYLAIGDNNGQVLIYNIKGDLITKFENQKGSTMSITALDWHPSKNILITVSEKIRMFDMEGNLIKTIKHRPEDALLLAVAWHKSGEFFVTGDYGYEDVKSLLQYWSEQGELLKTIDISKAEYRNLVWNAKGTRLASASDALRIWDKNGKLISEGSSIDNLWGLTWNKRGTRIVTSSMDQHIILWNKNAKKLLDIE